MERKSSYFYFMECADFAVETKLSCTIITICKNISTGQRICRTHVCGLCYNKDNILTISKIKQRRDMGGKYPLPVYQDYFDSNINIPSLSGRVSFTEKCKQKTTKWKTQVDKYVGSGKRKPRKV